MGMYPRGMREGMSTWSLTFILDGNVYIESGLRAGIAEHTYKPTLPTRFPTRNILTTSTIRRSLSTINQLELVRDSKEGSTGKRGCLEFKSSKTGMSPSSSGLMIDTRELAYETID
jgi:hypothetical protein